MFILPELMTMEKANPFVFSFLICLFRDGGACTVYTIAAETGCISKMFCLSTAICFF